MQENKINNQNSYNFICFWNKLFRNSRLIMFVVRHNARWIVPQMIKIIKILKSFKAKGVMPKDNIEIKITFKENFNSLNFTYKLLFFFSNIIANKHDRMADVVVEIITQYILTILNKIKFDIMLKIREKRPICIGVFVFFWE